MCVCVCVCVCVCHWVCLTGTACFYVRFDCVCQESGLALVGSKVLGIHDVQDLAVSSRKAAPHADAHAQADTTPPHPLPPPVIVAVGKGVQVVPLDVLNVC